MSAERIQDLASEAITHIDDRTVVAANLDEIYRLTTAALHPQADAELARRLMEAAVDIEQVDKHIPTWTWLPDVAAELREIAAALSRNAAPQPSTATTLPCALGENVGQGEVASAAPRTEQWYDDHDPYNLSRKP